MYSRVTVEGCQNTLNWNKRSNTELLKLLEHFTCIGKQGQKFEADNFFFVKCCRRF